MDCLDLNKVTCRICITGDECDVLSNLFTKKINETSGDAIKSIDDDYVLNMRLSDALQSFTCIELQQDRGLPETICRKCEFQLIETLSFIHRTNGTQQILHSYTSTSQETKVKIEEIDVHEDSSYLIEVLNDAGEVIQNEHAKISIPSVESNDHNEQIIDYDAEDAVSFLKSVKRGNLESNTTEPCKGKVVTENYSCNYCQKTFLQKPSLVYHMRLHANLRPYKCTHCDKSFAHSGNLKSHLRTHVTKVDDSVLNNETIDSYHSSTTSDSSNLQRRRKVSKQWLKVKEFPSFTEAAQEIKEENIWSKYCTNTSMSETSVIYRCNKVKARGEQCKAGRRIAISKSTEAITLFKSQNEHTCDKINDIHLSVRAPIPENVKKIVEEWFEKGLKYKQIRLELIKLQLPLPSDSKLKAYLKELRRSKLGQSTLSFHELFEQLTSLSDLPESPDKAYVVDFYIDKQEHKNFHFFATSKTLLQNALYAELMCTDTKCKLVWQGFPVHVLGTVDLNKKFHPFGISVSDKDDAEDFEFMYKCLKNAIAHNFNVDFNPNILMSNGAESISNGFKTVFGNEKLILMCSTQMKKTVKCKVTELIPASYHVEVMDDIDKLQLSSNPQIFEKASSLFIKKYGQFHEFMKYFQEHWLHANLNWYQGAAPFRNPSSNSALESFYRVIKDEKSLRERLPLESFMKLITSWIESWGLEYSSGDAIIATTTTVDLHLLRKGYGWMLSNKETKNNIDGSVMVPATDHSDLSQWNNTHEWDTFNEFKENAFIGYTTVVPEGENWTNGTCTCPDFYKNYLCEHVVGIAMRHNYLQIPLEVKIAPIGTKKRGRPPKPKCALIIS